MDSSRLYSLGLKLRSIRSLFDLLTDKCGLTLAHSICLCVSQISLVQRVEEIWFIIITIPIEADKTHTSQQEQEVIAGQTDDREPVQPCDRRHALHPPPLRAQSHNSSDCHRSHGSTHLQWMLLYRLYLCRTLSSTPWSYREWRSPGQMLEDIYHSTEGIHRLFRGGCQSRKWHARAVDIYLHHWIIALIILLIQRQSIINCSMWR